jgi:hypothetical protein
MAERAGSMQWTIRVGTQQHASRFSFVSDGQMGDRMAGATQLDRFCGSWLGQQ